MAVDSAGDVYASSAGESPSPDIKIFDPEHHLLGSITESDEEPCSLAVDSHGNLYVSELAAGRVVRYQPTEYPFSGTPSYLPPVTITEGGVRGISIDAGDNRLYVAESTKIAIFNPDGSFDESLGEGLLLQASGVAAFTGDDGSHYAFASDAAGAAPDRVYFFSGSTIAGLKLRSEADGSETPAGSFSFGAAGASLAVDRTGGHVLVYDAGHKVVDEFEATGTYLAQVDDLRFDDAKPTSIAVIPERYELQRIQTNATGGTFTLGFDGQITAVAGEGQLSASSPSVSEVLTSSGVFAVGEAIEGIGIKPNTTISAIGSGSLTLSQPTEASVPAGKTPLKAAIPYAATAVAVQSALESLLTIGKGNVNVQSVAAGGAPNRAYTVLFTDGLGKRNVTQLEADGSGLSGTESGKLPASVTTEAQGSGPGQLYVSTGPAGGAMILAFGPLAPPGRPGLGAPLSSTLPNACGVAIDSHGNRYVATKSTIAVYAPNPVLDSEGKPIPLTHVSENAGNTCDIAVDSAGNVYALDTGEVGVDDGSVTYYSPQSFPPTSNTPYSKHAPSIAEAGPPLFPSGGELNALGVNPTSGHVFVVQSQHIIEIDSAEHGSGVLNSDFASGLTFNQIADIASGGRAEDVYVLDAFQHVAVVLNQAGTEVLARITGAGSPKGSFKNESIGSVAVDQTNGHALIFWGNRGDVEEYEASGAFVARFGTFTPGLIRPVAIGVDGSGGTTSGNVYVAYDDTAPSSFDVTAFGPLDYGESPKAETELASKVSGGAATLAGTVDPRGFVLTECRFLYLTETQYEANGSTFAGAASVPCGESTAEIGSGHAAVPVHANLSLLDPSARYRFRLYAANEFGEDAGDPGVFGPPSGSADTAQPVLYDEATLRAHVDPAGLSTTYHFEYWSGSEGSTKSTPTRELPPSDGNIAVEAHLTGLSEETEYGFRIVFENEVASAEGLGTSFTTLKRAEQQACSNAEYRTGPSASLPECRAYELVTPAETGGARPRAPEVGFAHNWLVAPVGDEAGNRLSFTISGTTLASFDGNGNLDGYRARRGPGDHPVGGWQTELRGPSYVQTGGGHPELAGLGSDQEFSFWELDFPLEGFEGTLPAGNYVLGPAGFEPVGVGSLSPKSDYTADGDFVSARGAHVIFTSASHLEQNAAPNGIASIYDRTAGATSAKVISMPPDAASPATESEFETTNANYVGATEDGSSVVFRVGSTLYLHREGSTTEVAEGATTFAGISDGGTLVFYAGNASGSVPAVLFACDAQSGPCAGAGAHAPIEISPVSIFVNVSADGSHAFFTSETAIEGVGPNGAGAMAQSGANNLYAWDGEAIHFIALLDPQDLVSFEGVTEISLRRWSVAVTSPGNFSNGRANSPTRSTPSGDTFVFQSHRALTKYNSNDHTEIYRYSFNANGGDELICISCNPTGAPPESDAALQSYISDESPVSQSTLIPNVTDNGNAVFFNSSDQLLPEDANDVNDVYEWRAYGVNGCQRSLGCLALISSGQGEAGSYIYSMTPDGHDVFFSTKEKLVGEDITGSPSIYDARVDGGIPSLAARVPCRGDACQGQGSGQPTLPQAGSESAGSNGNVVAPAGLCGKGKRKVRRRGKTRCIKAHHRRRPAHGNGKGGR